MPYFTEKEYYEKFEYYTLQLEQRFLEEEDFKFVSDRLPCMAILSRSEDVEIIHTNKKHQEIIGFSHEEVRENCPEYLNQIVHPVSLRNVKQFLPAFYENHQPQQTTVFLQYVRLYGKPDYSPVLTFTKPPRHSDGLVIRLPVMINEFDKASKKMEQVVEMNQFKLKTFKRFQQLTSRELEILKFLANGYKNNQIAEQLFISRQTVETHRKNLKRKLEIKSYRDLVKYAFAFNLITF